MIEPLESFGMVLWPREGQSLCQRGRGQKLSKWWEIEKKRLLKAAAM